MSHTKESAKISYEKVREKYGDEWIEERGRKGGKVKNPNKGFGSDRERAAAAGRKGGARSKRPVNKKVIQEGSNG